MLEITEIIPWLISIIIFVAGIITSKLSQTKQDGREIEAIKQDVSYIKEAIDEMKSDKNKNNDDMKVFLVELTKIQQSVNSQWKQIDEMKIRVSELERRENNAK